MILMRLIAWLRRRPVPPDRDERAALLHLIVLGLALTLVAQGAPVPTAPPAAHAAGHVR